MNFQIPKDVNNDILYCQRSLRHYMHVHQMLAATLSSNNMLDDPRLAELENEIFDIGCDQKRMVNRLRLHMENYFIFLEKQNLSIDRLTANANVANQLFQNFQMSYDKFEPINVKKRLSDNELIDRYIYNRVTTSGSAAADVMRITECNRATSSGSLAADAIETNECSSPETLEAVTSPSGDLFQNNTIAQLKSLLKPKSERLVAHPPKNDSDEQLHSSSSSANLKSRRLNLRQVLQTRAENQTQNVDKDDKNVQKIDNSITLAPVVNKTNEDYNDDDVIFIDMTPIKTDIISNSPTLSLSSSASSLSGDTFDKRDLFDDDKVRKLRTRISTEKRDFHYGNIDIFERQSVRSNDSAFLKYTQKPRSIQTKSVAGSSFVKPKSASKSNSSKYDDMKLCTFCLKNANSEKILECGMCSVYYHVGCHKLEEGTQRIKSRYCPDCLRKEQNAKEKMMADLRRK